MSGDVIAIHQGGTIISVDINYFACGVEILRVGWEHHFGAAGGPFRDIAQIDILSILCMLTPVTHHCVI